ncbi:hypothetical protein [Bacillus sp. FJAT-22090]|uniref:hypothetical protein n=1 Tax=Bacillus sp. FJAT-22090 TaxID=1581038 RepID=UPI00119E5763|nr:hypothetical protein [Bacillus sp. FJAT-22090]
MELKIARKIEEHLTLLTQEKWNELMIELGASKLLITKEQLMFSRHMYQIAYQEGCKDTHEQMKDIYFNDPDEFQEMFEKDDEENL